MTTVFASSKQTHRVRAQVTQARGILQEAVGLSIEGYEIHMGRSFHAEEWTAPEEGITHFFSSRKGPAGRCGSRMGP